MGGKTGTTTQQSSVSIPPEVLARYNAVNARAETTAQQPFTPYSGEFVAPLTGTQQAGISNINQAQGIAGPYYDAAGQAMTAGYQSAQPYYGAATSSMMGGQQNANALQGEAYQGINQAYYGAQPYQGVATGLGLASAGAVNPEALTGQNINQYMSPYVQDVVGTTMANLRQQQQQEQSQLLGNQITSGAFGGDRGRIAQANLARQQELASGQTVAGLMNQGYGQALQTAQQQQAQQLAAEQANRAALAGAGQQLGALGQQGFSQGMSAAQQQAALGQQAFAQGAQGAQTYQGLGQGLYGMGQEYGKNVAGLGTQAQQAALQGAQAQLGAGTVEQQTQQAQDTAQYNQFLQGQGYPFQIAQFLANIAMGTGALSGSTTNATTTSPQSFFSDRRLKEDVEKIGKTYDGQDIVRYKYKGEPGTRIGLIAQDVEKHHPDAVGLAGGYRTVDYDKATDKAAERGHFADGGLAGGYSSEGGAVMPEMAGMGFAQGGSPDINSMLGEILNAHQGMYPYGKAGLYGQTGGRAGAYGTSQMQLPSRGLMRAELVRAVEQPGAGAQAMQGLNTARGIGSAYTEGSNALFGSEPTAANPQGGTGVIGRGGNYNPGQGGLANFVRRLTQGSEPTSTVEVSARQPDQSTSLNDASLGSNASVVSGDGLSVSANAAGGLVRGHYAMGGLPFSEAGGYIPESVLNDDETEKNKKAMQGLSPSTAPGGGQSGSGSGPGLLGTLGQVGGAIQGAKALGSAASSIGSGIEEMLPLLLLKSGGAVPRHGYAFDGEVSANQEGMAGLAGLEGGLGRANDNSLEVERIVNSLGAIESGRRGDYNAIGTAVPREGRAPDYAHGRYQVMGENIGPWTEAALGRRLSPQEFLADHTAQENVVRHRVQQDLNRYGNARDVASRWFSGQPVAQAGNVQDPNRVNVPEYLRRFDEAYGSYSPGAGLGAPAAMQAAGQRAPASTNALGAAQYTGDGGDGSQTTDRAAERQERAGVNFNYPREQREPNWMQRHQDWLVPVLSGLGAMASSPSRYLGSALLQGVAGGAQQYASMQNKAEEQQLARGALEVSQEQARTAATREETASQVAAQQVMDAFDRRYRQIVRPDGTIAFIDQTGGGTLTAEQHAQQRATLFNALLTGNRGVRALSAGQARPGTTEGAVTAAPAGNAAPRPAPAGNAAPEATLTDENISRVSPTGVTTSGGAPAAPAPAPSGVAPSGPTERPPGPALTGPSAPPPANQQEAAALAEANRFLQPRVDELAAVNRTIRDFENQNGAGSASATLIQRREKLEDQIRAARNGTTPIDDPDGLRPANDYFVRQNAELVARTQSTARQREATDVRIRATGEQAQAFLQEYPAAEQLLNNMAHLRQLVETNRGSTAVANLLGYTTQIPWIGEFMRTEAGRRLQMAADAGNKEGVQLGFRTLAESANAQGAPASGLRAALLTVATPEMNPGAAYMNVTERKAEHYRDMKYYRDWIAAGQPDPLTYRPGWLTANPTSGFLQQAVNSTPYFAGMTEVERRDLPMMREDDPLRPRPAGQAGQAGQPAQPRAGQTGQTAPAQPAQPQQAQQAFVRGRKIVVRDGQWVFEDTGEAYRP